MKNSLWKPPKTDKKSAARVKIWHCPRDGFDPICVHCKNRGRCEDPCIFLGYVNGRTETHEAIIAASPDNFSAAVDYKELCADLNAAIFPASRLEEISEISDLKTRGLFAMLAVRMPKKAIAGFRISEREIYRVLGRLLAASNGESD